MQDILYLSILICCRFDAAAARRRAISAPAGSAGNILRLKIGPEANAKVETTVTGQPHYPAVFVVGRRIVLIEEVIAVQRQAVSIVVPGKSQAGIDQCIGRNALCIVLILGGKRLTLKTDARIQNNIHRIQRDGIVA